ncbi:MAG: acylphosphatase [Melioribacteraceae bacterium]|nr:acylphosphatase [Melioribacteraceae bacterium]
MADNNKRAEIIVNGVVQGVGFRYFVLGKARNLGLTGFTQNLFTGEVLTVVEGPEHLIHDLYKNIRIGPGNAHVTKHQIKWDPPKNEFKEFKVRY